jgi:hypothetical protein
VLLTYNIVNSLEKEGNVNSWRLNDLNAFEGELNKLTTFEEREIFSLKSDSNFTCCLRILEKETSFDIGQFPTLCSFLSERRKNEKSLSELEKRVDAIFLKAISSPSKSPLALAVRSSNFNQAIVLLQAGSSVDEKDEGGNSVIDLLLSSEREGLGGAGEWFIQLLIERKAVDWSLPSAKTANEGGTRFHALGKLLGKSYLRISDPLYKVVCKLASEDPRIGDAIDDKFSLPLSSLYGYDRHMRPSEDTVEILEECWVGFLPEECPDRMKKALLEIITHLHCIPQTYANDHHNLLPPLTELIEYLLSTAEEYLRNRPNLTATLLLEIVGRGSRELELFQAITEKIPGFLNPPRGQIFLEEAINKSDNKLVRYLINKGVPVNEPYLKAKGFPSSASFSVGDATPLQHALKMGSESLFDLILANTSTPNLETVGKLCKETGVPIPYWYQSRLESQEQKMRAPDLDPRTDYQTHVSNKVLGHMLLDASATEKVDEQRERIEGIAPEHSMQYFSALSGHGAKTYGKYLKEGTLKKLKYAAQLLASSLPLARSVSTLSEMELASPEKLQKEVERTLEALALNEEFVMPAGWSGDPGHALLMKFKKQADGSLAFTLYSTGSGIGEAQTTEKFEGKLYVDAKREGVVSLEDLKKSRLVQQLLEFLIIRKHEFGFRHIDIKEVMNTIQPFLTKTSTLPLWVQAQRSGTCGMRCIYAFMSDLLGEKEYKIWKTLAMQDTLEAGIASGVDHSLLELAEPNLQRRLGKLIESGVPLDLTELQERQKKAAKAIDRVRVTGNEHQLESSLSLSTDSDAIKRAIAEDQTQETSASTSPAMANVQQAIPSMDFSAVVNVESLIDKMGAFQAYMEQLGDSNDVNAFGAEALCLIGRALWQTPEGPLRKSLEEASPELIQDVLTKLTALAEILHKQENPADLQTIHQTHAQEFSLITGHYLIGLLEKDSEDDERAKISTYPILANNSIREERYVWPKSYIVGAEDAINHALLFAARKAQMPKDKRLDSLCSFEKLVEVIVESGWTQQRITKVLLTRNDLEYGSHFAKKFSKEKEEGLLKELKSRVGDPTQGQRQNFLAAKAFEEQCQKSPLKEFRKLAFFAYATTPGSQLNVSDETLCHSLNFCYSNKDYIAYGLHPEASRSAFMIQACVASRSGVRLKDPERKLNLNLIEYEELNSIILRNPREGVAIRSLLKSFYEEVSARSDKGSPFLFWRILIDLFEENKDYFGKYGFQQVLHAVLFNRKTRQVLQKNKDLFNECLLLFDNGIEKYKNQVLIKENVASSIEALVFLADSRQRLCQYPPGTDTEMKDSIRILSEMLNSDDFKKEEIQYALHLSLLEAISSLREPSEEEAKEALISIYKLDLLSGKKKTYDASNPIQISSLPLFKLRLKETLEKVLQNPPLLQAAVKEIFLLNNIPPHELTLLDREHFPNATVRVSGKVYTLDLMHGKLFHEGRQIVPLGKSYEYDSLCRKFFQGKELSVVDQGAFFETDDGISAVRLFKAPYSEISHLSRLYPDGWYTFLGASSPIYHTLGIFPGNPRLEIWIKKDSEPPIYKITTENGKVHEFEMTAEGHFIFSKEEGSVERVSKGNLPQGLLNFDNSAVIWRSVKDPKTERLQFPSYLSPSGAFLEFEKRGEDWVWKSHPHLKLSNKQAVRGILSWNRFIVLTDEQGNDEIFFPALSLSNLKARQLESVPMSCMRAPLVNGELSSREPVVNAYFAYLLLTHAKGPKDYENAIKYMKNAFRFEGYSKEESLWIEKIYRSIEELKDYDANAISCRLYAAWLLHDNQIRNPASKAKVPLPNVSELMDEYRLRRGNASFACRLENILDPNELLFFEGQTLYEQGVEMSSVPSVLPRAVIPQSEIQVDLADLSPRKRANADLPSRLSLPGEEFGAFFNRYYDDIPFLTEKEKENVQVLLQASYYDNSGNNPSLRKILHAKYASCEPSPDPSAIALVAFVDRIRSESLHRAGDWRAQADFERELSTLYKNYDEPPVDVSYSTLRDGIHYRKPKFLPQRENLTLADAVPEVSAHVLTVPPNPLNIQKLYDDNFTGKKPDLIAGNKPFEQKGASPQLERSIEKFNEDNAAGIAKNQSLVEHTAKGDLADLNVTVKAEYERLQSELSTLQEQILSLARKYSKDPQEATKQRAEEGGGTRPVLELNDCIAIVLSKSFDQLDNLDENERIKFNELLQIFVVLSNRQSHLGWVLEDLQIPGNDQKVGEALLQTSQVDLSKDPFMYATFEYFLNQDGMRIALTEEHLAGLNEMKGAQSCFIQKLQGGGKTLTWGTITALEKADGYHLSIHVPPSAHVRSALYDMKHLANRLFRLKERTLDFDDNPVHFTPQALKRKLSILERAIVKREFVTIAPETLQAMQTKYDKKMLQSAQFRKDGAVEAADSIDQSLRILEEILQLFDARAIFTFDECHLALDPHRDLRMPIQSNAHPPEKLQSFIHAKVLAYAALAKNKEGQPLLDLKGNKQSQQTDEDSREMHEQVIERLMNDTDWLESISARSVENKLDLRAYLKGERKSIPSFLERQKQEGDTSFSPVHGVVLVKQLLAGNWLKERLKEGVSETHGNPQISPDGKDALPISVPFRNNMDPALGSEFSDPDVLLSNTLILYAVEGLKLDQVKELIELERKKAKEELEYKQQMAPDYTLQNTETVKQFFKASGIALFSVDSEQEDDLRRVQEGLNELNENALMMTFHYVINHVLQKVELYDEQVVSGGQDLAIMGKKAIAYTGSMENPHLIPFGAKRKLDIGTNGQTTDLLLRQNDDVHVVPNDPHTLLASLLSDNPNKDKVRSLIDAGCHFRGVSNVDAAKSICKWLKDTKSPLKGVIFYNSDKKPCFMDKDFPDNPKTLSGTQPPSLIQSETRCLPSERFTFYGHEQITGIDILQAEDAIAVLTVGEGTQIHSLLQGSRRLRGLQKQQRIMTVVQESAVPLIKKKLELPAEQKLSMHPILLYCQINEVEDFPEENLMIFTQKMEALLRKTVRGKRITLKGNTEKRDQLTLATKQLFVKRVAVDLFHEYAKAKVSINVEDYILILKSRFLDMLIDSNAFDEAEITSIKDELVALQEEMNDDLVRKIDVHEDFPESFDPETAGQNREASAVQYQEATEKGDSAADNIAIGQQKNISRDQRERLNKEELIEEIAFDTGVLSSKEFCNSIQAPSKGAPCLQRDQSSENPEVWHLKEALELIFPGLGKYFHLDLLLSSNVAAIRAGEIELFGRFRKKSEAVLIIKEGPHFKLLLCSQEDFRVFQEEIRVLKKAPPEDSKRSYFLVSPTGKRIEEFLSDGDSLGDLEQAAPRHLLLQTLLFSGNLYRLNRTPWYQILESWLQSSEGERKDKQEFCRALLDKSVSDDDYPTLKSSRVWKLLNTL